MTLSASVIYVLCDIICSIALTIDVSSLNTKFLFPKTGLDFSSSAGVTSCVVFAAEFGLFDLSKSAALTIDAFPNTMRAWSPNVQ